MARELLKITERVGGRKLRLSCVLAFAQTARRFSILCSPRVEEKLLLLFVLPAALLIDRRRRRRRRRRRKYARALEQNARVRTLHIESRARAFFSSSSSFSLLVRARAELTRARQKSRERA